MRFTKRALLAGASALAITKANAGYVTLLGAGSTIPGEPAPPEWPPDTTDLATALDGTTRIWHEPFDVLSLRTGGYATGSETTGYNAASSRGIWAPNGVNYMTHPSRYPGLSAYSYTLNHVADWQAIDPTFPPLAMYDITADGLILRATGDYPLVRASLPTVGGGNPPYLASFLTTAPSARFARPYIMRVRFKLMTLTTDEFPAIWTTGEHYARDINDPTWKHYEIDLMERFGNDNPNTHIATSTHIDPGGGIVSGGGAYNTGGVVGPDVQFDMYILHTTTKLLAWLNGALVRNITLPVNSQKPGDRDHVILNQLIGMTWRAFPAGHPDATLLVQSIEVFKPSVTPQDLIPPTPPIPVLAGFTGTISNGDPEGTVVGTLSGATSYRVIGYPGLTVSGSNLITAGSQVGGDYTFYIEGLAADGTPGIPPAYALHVTTDAPALSSPMFSPTERTTADISVSTDTGSGTLYWIVDADATTASQAEIKLGQKAGGAAAIASGNVVVSASGVQSITGVITGLTAGTAYTAQFVHAGTQDSAVSKSAATETFSTDAFNYYNLFSTPATVEVKKLINDFIRGLQIDGNWATLDAIQIYAMKPDLAGAMVTQVALLDMRTPARVPTATGSPALTSGLGFVTDGVNDIIDTMIIPSAGPNYTQNSAYIGYWSTQSDLRSTEMDTGSGVNAARIGPRSANDTLQYNVNQNLAGTSFNGVVTDARGYSVANRSTSNATQGYKNGGANIAGSTQVSGGISGASFKIGRVFGTTFRASSCAGVLTGGSRTQAQNLQIYNRLRTLMTALGVA